MTETLNNTALSPVDNLEMMLERGTTVMGYHPDVRRGSEGIYMCDVLPETALGLEFQYIHQVEQLGMGASDTHHEVRFATVKYSKPTGEDVEVLVGVKHFDDALENAIGECNALLEVQKRGFDALAPVAIVKESETSAYLITLFRPDVRSLDNAEWAIRPGERGFQTVTENLRFIADSLGSLHASGIFHGDAQPKNFLRSDTGRQVVADLEIGCKIAGSTYEHVDAYNDIQESKTGSAVHDLKLFWATLNRGIGLRQKNIFLGEEATPEELYTVFREHFVIPYLYKLEELTDPTVYSQLDLEGVMLRLDTIVRKDIGLSEDASAG